MDLGYANWNKSNGKKTSNVWLHLYVKYKKTNSHNKTNRLVDTENKLVVAKEERDELTRWGRLSGTNL